jgi:hypothetical protein
MANQNSGFPKNGKNFSALGRTTREGTYTAAKFNQAAAGLGESINTEFIGTQQVNYNASNIGGGGVEIPTAQLIPTFYILAENGDILNGYMCATDQEDRLMWPVV